MQWSLQTLGTFRLTGDETDFPTPPTQKARALLAYLVWHQGVDLSRERLIELFWPECDPDRGRSSLKTALWSIRRCFREGAVDPDTVIAANKTRVVWLAPSTMDATTFERHVAIATDMPSMRVAISLYGGEFLANDYTDWCVAQRERLASLYEGLLSSAVSQEGDIASARLLVATEWFEELPYAIVARAELASGRIAAAATAIEQCRRALAEIGSAPSEGFQTEFCGVTRPRTTPVERGLTLPFCGRTQELETLHRIMSAASNGTGALVVVQGVSGSGKSELLWHAERTARDIQLRVATVRGLEGDPHAFGPWAELYSQLTSEPFEQFVARRGDSASLAAALRSALGSSALLIVDDAQYLAGDSKDVLARLANDAPAAGLGLLIGARPTPDRRFLLLRGAIVLETDALTFGEIEAAIRQRASQNAGPVVDYIFTRSGGHPFFAARLLESLGQSGTLRIEQNAWVFSRDPHAMQTPASICNFIEASLYSRGKDVPLVACALALEPDATSEDVIAATGLEEVTTFDAIDDLLAMGLLEQPAHGPEFRFAHDLIKEAAMRALNSGRRVKIHRAYAARFSDDAREECVRRARHLRASGQVLAAAKALHLAAYESLQINAWHDALELATSAIELCLKLNLTKLHELLAQLHEVAARACEESGDLDKALMHCDERVAHARETHDTGLVSQALGRRVVVYIARGLPREALLNANESLTFARLQGDRARLTFSLLRRSLCFQMLGEGNASIGEAREAFQEAQRCDDIRLVASAMERLITALSIQLHLHEALQLADHALDLARKSDPRTQAALRLRRSSVLYLAGRCDEAAGEADIVATMLAAPETKIGMPGLHGFSTPDLIFMRQAQRATLALAAADWDDVLHLSEFMLAGPAARAQDRRTIAELFEVFGRLGRNSSADRAGLYERAFEIRSSNVAKGLIGMGLSQEVACACVAVRTGRADGAEVLRAAAERLEDQYRHAPLDTDRGFALLAEAGTEIALHVFSHKMRLRATELYERRLKNANQPRSTDRSSSSRAQIREVAG